MTYVFRVVYIIRLMWSSAARSVPRRRTSLAELACNAHSLASPHSSLDKASKYASETTCRERRVHLCCGEGLKSKSCVMPRSCSSSLGSKIRLEAAPRTLLDLLDCRVFRADWWLDEYGMCEDNYCAASDKPDCKCERRRNP